MASALSTRDHTKIKEWVEKRGGKPAQVEGTAGLLRIDFGKKEERLERVSWDNFFRAFDEKHLNFLYDPEKKSYFNKFVDDDEIGGKSRK